MPAGQLLVQPGTAGSGMFFIAEGTAVVETKRDEIELGPGQFFGELALISEDATRTARVQAKTDLRCLALDRASFRDARRRASGGRGVAARGRPRPPGRERRRRRQLAAKAQWAGVQPVCREPRRAADAPAERGPAHRAAARVPPAERAQGGGARPRPRARGGQGARPLLQRVREPDRGRDLRDLPRRAARPHDRLRRRAARRPDLGRAHARVPRPLPRARRLALAARRRRAGAPAHRPSCSAASSATASRRSCSRRTRT